MKDAAMRRAWQKYLSGKSSYSRGKRHPSLQNLGNEPLSLIHGLLDESTVNGQTLEILYEKIKSDLDLHFPLSPDGIKSHHEGEAIAVLITVLTPELEKDLPENVRSALNIESYREMLTYLESIEYARG